MTPINQPIVELWTAVFGELPPITTSDAMMLEVLVRHLPLAPPYGQPEIRTQLSTGARPTRWGDSAIEQVDRSIAEFRVA